MARRALLAVALLALTASTTAQAAQRCVPAREAEALLLAMAPTLVGSVAAGCATTLPPNALLRRSVGPLTAKYAAHADAAWPLAKEALKKIVDPEASDLLESELARPMLTAMIAPMLAKEIKPNDCPNIDRILTLIDPLPAKNTAGLVVALIEMADRDKPARAAKGKFAICPKGAARP